MLSSMETPAALTVISPGGGMPLRIPKSNSSYQEAREIANSDMPAELAWRRLQELMADPLLAIKTWLSKCGGIHFEHSGDTFSLGAHMLNKQKWLPYLEKVKNSGADPVRLMTFLKKLSQIGDPQEVNPSGLCLHIHEPFGGVSSVNIMAQVKLPPAAKPGDIVDVTSSGSTPFLVSYYDFDIQDESVTLREGFVLSPVNAEMLPWIDDIMDQPMLLGLNRTYRCEEGTNSGWLEDMSFDSLSQARQNAKEIQKSGSEARIVNRLTGTAVALF